MKPPPADSRADKKTRRSVTPPDSQAKGKGVGVGKNPAAARVPERMWDPKTVPPVARGLLPPKKLAQSP